MLNFWYSYLDPFLSFELDTYLHHLIKAFCLLQLSFLLIPPDPSLFLPSLILHTFRSSYSSPLHLLISLHLSFSPTLLSPMSIPLLHADSSIFPKRIARPALQSPLQPSLRTRHNCSSLASNISCLIQLTRCWGGRERWLGCHQSHSR